MRTSQELSFGLLGEKLGHSHSPAIHAHLGSAPYELLECSADEARELIVGKAWRGLNVTIPYKALAAELADERSIQVDALGVANVLLHTADDKIYADNSDVAGFAWMVRAFFEQRAEDAVEQLQGAKALILGSGGAARAVRWSLEHDFSCTCIVVSRTGDDRYEGLAKRHGDAALIVNCTPVGMYPSCPASPLPKAELVLFGQLKAVLDVIYNPLKTQLVIDAEALGIPSQGGLTMLTAQAVFASELFQDKKLNHARIEQLTSSLERELTNVVLIGMPGVGKTSTGRKLAHLLRRPFVDIDDAIELKDGRNCATIIQEDGEASFRALETEVFASYAKESGLIIACGGGVVTKDENLMLARQNSQIVRLVRPLDELETRGRPLSQAKGIAHIAAERESLYKAWADFELDCTGSAESDAAAIAAALKLNS